MTGPGPNLFVVGTAKAGTTALWWYLDKHLEVHMSAVKEPHFFSRGGTGMGQTPVKDPVAYARLFAPGAGRRYRGEASPSYLEDAATPGRIKAASPDARIVVSLRDPVERAWSNYLMGVDIGYEDRSFEQAVNAEIGGDVPDLFDQPPPYLTRGIYADRVPRYLDTFGEQTFVLFFEEWVADVPGMLRRLFGWLDVDPARADTIPPVQIFAKREPRGTLARAILRLPGSHAVGDTVLRGRAVAPAQRALFRRARPPLAPSIRRLLRRFYAPHDARLRELLGRSLPWEGRQ